MTDDFISVFNDIFNIVYVGDESRRIFVYFDSKAQDLKILIDPSRPSSDRDGRVMCFGIDNNFHGVVSSFL